MSIYRIELENDEFDITRADTDDEAIENALEEYNTVLNVILLDHNYYEVKTVF